MNIASGSSQSKSGYPKQAPARVTSAIHCPSGGNLIERPDRHQCSRPTCSARRPSGQALRQNHLRRARLSRSSGTPSSAIGPSDRAAIADEIATKGADCCRQQAPERPRPKQQRHGRHQREGTRNESKTPGETWLSSVHVDRRLLCAHHSSPGGALTPKYAPCSASILRTFPTSTWRGQALVLPRPRPLPRRAA